MGDGGAVGGSPSGHQVVEEVVEEVGWAGPGGGGMVGVRLVTDRGGSILGERWV